jgi:hypothetical protein
MVFKMRAIHHLLPSCIIQSDVLVSTTIMLEFHLFELVEDYLEKFFDLFKLFVWHLYLTYPNLYIQLKQDGESIY